MAVHPWHPPVCTGAGTFGHQEGSGLALLAARKDGGTRQKLQRDEKWAQPTRPALVQWRHAKTAEAQVDVHAAAFQAMALRHALRSKVNLAAVAMPSCKRRGRHGALRAGIHACQPRGMDGRHGRSGLPLSHAPRLTADGAVDGAVQAILPRHQAVVACQLLTRQGRQLLHLAVGWALGAAVCEAAKVWASWRDGSAGSSSPAGHIAAAHTNRWASPVANCKLASQLQARVTAVHLPPPDAVGTRLQPGGLLTSWLAVGRWVASSDMQRSIRSTTACTRVGSKPPLVSFGPWPLFSWQ